MATWNDYDLGLELTDEQKLDFLGQLCTPHIPNELKLAFLDRLAESGWQGIAKLKQDFVRKLSAANSSNSELREIFAKLDKTAASGWLVPLAMFMMVQQKFTVHCVMPNNDHDEDDQTEEYRCRNPNLTEPHHFCKHHQLNMCPIDNFAVYLVP